MVQHLGCKPRLVALLVFLLRVVLNPPLVRVRVLPGYHSYSLGCLSSSLLNRNGVSLPLRVVDLVHLLEVHVVFVLHCQPWVLPNLRRVLFRLEADNIEPGRLLVMNVFLVERNAVMAVVGQVGVVYFRLVILLGLPLSYLSSSFLCWAYG